MKPRWIISGILLACLLNGCHKERVIQNFPISAELTIDSCEEAMGPPDILAPNWCAYTLTGGSELRLYFLNGPKGGVRKLSRAILFSPDRRYGRTLFTIEEPTAPTSAPASRPTTSSIPATTSIAPTTLP